MSQRRGPRSVSSASVPVFTLAFALAGSLTAPGCAKQEPASAETKAEPAAPAEAEKEEKEEKNPEPAPVADPNEACAKLLVVAHTEVDDDHRPDGLIRDRAAAQTKAESLQRRLAEGTDFAAVVASDSDHARTQAKRGGFGTFTRDAWPEAYAALLEPTFALGIGERSGVLDTPLGFAIVERCPVDKVHTRHILIRYAGAKRADETITRSRDQAKAAAAAIRAAIAGGEDFAAAAREKGEDGTAERGGDLGPIGRGMFAIAYEDAAWALKPGELSSVIETDFGFHVIERVAVAPSP